MVPRNHPLGMTGLMLFQLPSQILDGLSVTLFGVLGATKCYGIGAAISGSGRQDVGMVLLDFGGLLYELDAPVSSLYLFLLIIISDFS